MHTKLKSSSQNAFRYPTLFKALVKLIVGWIAVCMVYYGILMGNLPGGVLINNLYLGFASFLVTPLMNILMASKYAFRRPILTTQFAIVGIGCVALAYLDSYNSK